MLTMYSTGGNNALSVSMDNILRDFRSHKYDADWGSKEK